MPEHMGFLDEIIIFLITAVVIVWIFKRLNVSPILGYLVAGVLIGPFVLGFFKETAHIRDLGELGVVFLLFTIGLELPLQRLQALRRYVFGLGTLQVLVVGGIFSVLAYHFFSLSVGASLLVGSILSLSSTAVVIQILSERGELSARFGRASFSVLLFQDLFFVLLLVMVGFLTKETSMYNNIFTALLIQALKGLAVLGSITFVGRYILRPIYRSVAAVNSPDLFMATTLLVVLGTSFITAQAEMSLELGAFLAGILLAETEYRHQVEADILPFRGLLLGVFFMTVGMSINLTILYVHTSTVLFVLLGMMAIKIVITTFLSKLFGLSLISCLRVGLFLSCGGEFVYVLLSPSVLMKTGIPNELADILFLVVSLSMALMPLMAMLGKKLADKHFEKEARIQVDIQKKDTVDLKRHVIIVGFGRVGQMVGHLLAQNLVSYVGIDKNMGRVADARANGVPVFFGDAKRIGVLDSLGVDRAKAVVVTINHPASSVRLVATLKRHYPDLEVFVRVRDQEHAEKLAHLGARLILPETIEPSLQLASAVLQVLGIAPEEISQVMDSFRKSQTHAFKSGDFTQARY